MYNLYVTLLCLIQLVAVSQKVGLASAGAHQEEARVRIDGTRQLESSGLDAVDDAFSV